MSTTTTPGPAKFTPMPVAHVDEEDQSWFGPIRRICWALGCLFTLGYANKYARKIQYWEVLDPAYKDPGYEEFSAEPMSSRDMGMRTSIRAKQQVSELFSKHFLVIYLYGLQKEWDRLGMTVSSTRRHLILVV